MEMGRKRELRKALTQAYTTPIDAEDIYTMSVRLDAVMNGERWVELQPAPSSIRRLQHQMARDANLVSHSYGKEPNRRVRIYREQ